MTVSSPSPHRCSYCGALIAVGAQLLYRGWMYHPDTCWRMAILRGKVEDFLYADDTTPVGGMSADRAALEYLEWKEGNDRRNEGTH